MAKKKPTRKPTKRITADVIQTRCLVLVDEQGHERAELTCVDSWTVVQLYGPNGVPRLQLHVDPAGSPRITLWDHENHPTISLSVSPHGSDISVISGDGRNAINLGTQALDE